MGPEEHEMSPLAYWSFSRRSALATRAQAVREVDVLFRFREHPIPAIQIDADSAENANITYFAATTGHVCPQSGLM